MLRFMASSTFPAFYGLALPLLKYGQEVRPVLLDNVRRYAGYLDEYKVLLVSYEFVKPDAPDMNTAIAEWVKRGGTLIYIGDGKDPYHKINSWWTGRYDTPAQHLFEMLGITPTKEKQIFACGKGTVAVWQVNPCVFCFSQKNADAFRGFFTKVVPDVQYKNHLLLERGEYTVAAVMDESCNDTPLVLRGTFADMFTTDFKIVKQKTVKPGENTLLCNIGRLASPLCVVGTSVRVFSLTEDDGAIYMTVRGASDFEANIRLKVPCPVTSAFIDGEPASLIYDKKSGTALVTFASRTGERYIRLQKEHAAC